MPQLRYKPGDVDAVRACIAACIAESSVETFPTDSGAVRLELDGGRGVLTDPNAIARRIGKLSCCKHVSVMYFCR